MDMETIEQPEAEDAKDGSEAVSPYDLGDVELVRVLRKWFKEGMDAKRDALPKRKRCHEVYANKQWDDADIEKAKQLKRPTLTLNMVLAIISAIEGYERENRAEIKFYGNEETDDKVAHGLNRLLKWVMKQCGGEFELSDQFRNTMIAGQDWIGVTVDYLEDPEGRICLEQVDDEEMVEDPLGKSPVGSDDRYIHRHRMMPEDEINAKWPGALAKLHQSCSESGDGDPESDGKGFRDVYSEPGNATSTKLYDAKGKQWLVVETHWYQIEPGYHCLNEATGQLEECSQAELDVKLAQRKAEQEQAMQAMIAAVSMPPAPALPGLPAPAPEMPRVPGPLEYRERPIKRLYRAFHCYDVLLEKAPYEMRSLKRFPYVPQRAFRDKARKTWFAFVELIMDVQLQHNIEQSIIVQLQQLMPKASWMGPKGAFHNKQDWEKGLARPGAMLEYNASRGKPEPIPQPTVPRHMIDMMVTRTQAMRDISGVNFEMSGRGADTGVVIEKRKASAKTSLAPVFDNYRRTKIELGKVLLAFIQHYIKPGRIIRVVGPDGNSEQVIMSREMQVGRFDITVDEGEDSINDQFDALYVLQTTLPQMMKAGIPITPEFIDLLPIPPHIRQTWKRQIAWEMTLAGRVPPPGWEPGMPIPQAGGMMPGLPMPGSTPEDGVTNAPV
jgi:hypothetical protein